MAKTSSSSKRVSQSKAERDYRRALWMARDQARMNAMEEAAKERIRAMSDEEQRAMLLTPSTAGW